MSFEAGDIVVVDYPHVETNLIKRRPALVISAGPIGPDGLVVWVAMITNATNRRWPGDVEVEDHMAMGLPIASIVRTEKITTLESAGAEKIGHASDWFLSAVLGRIAGHLGLGVTEL